jgi:hypothetical protein
MRTKVKVKLTKRDQAILRYLFRTEYVAYRYGTAK